MTPETTQATLTETQKKEAIYLFKNGVTHYTDISKMLNVTYNSVNTFMTKYKYQVGILKKKKKVVKKEDKSLEDDLLGGKLNTELKFLMKLRLLIDFHIQNLTKPLRREGASH